MCKSIMIQDCDTPAHQKNIFKKRKSEVAKSYGMGSVCRDFSVAVTMSCDTSLYPVEITVLLWFPLFLGAREVRFSFPRCAPL